MTENGFIRVTVFLQISAISWSALEHAKYPLQGDTFLQRKQKYAQNEG